MGSYIATYSSNTTIKIGSAITSSASGTGTITIYTVPANSYLHLWYAEATAASSSGSVIIQAAGIQIASKGGITGSSNCTFGIVSGDNVKDAASIVLGAGSTITYTTFNASSGSGFIRGTLFQNTP